MTKLACWYFFRLLRSCYEQDQTYGTSLKSSRKVGVGVCDVPNQAEDDVFPPSMSPRSMELTQWIHVKLLPVFLVTFFALFMQSGSKAYHIVYKNHQVCQKLGTQNKYLGERKRRKAPRVAALILLLKLTSPIVARVSIAIIANFGEESPTKKKQHASQNNK